jgi:hypothetical protein
MTMTWAWPTWGLGAFLALIVAILAVVLVGVGRMDLTAALVVIAICAVRL